MPLAMTPPSTTAPAAATALDVAKGLITIANGERVAIPETGETYVEGITHLKLQKMLYFAQAAHLALHGKPLFDDEIEAWSLGPVVPAVYNVYRSFHDGNLALPEREEVRLPEDVMRFLQDMWAIFGKYTAAELVDMSHRHAPWKDVYRPDTRHIPITKESMMRFYRTTKAFTAK
jgi:uncharacterized phage-associated protein